MAKLPPGEPPIAEHQPYIPDSARIPEFTWSAVVMGSLLGIVFGASSLYLVLKVGMTVSASIPVAVLSITLFRAFSRVFGLRPATILENNIVQTAGSAGESIAFGVGVTMPALMILGFEMDISRIMVVSILGGLLGILMMIPLRRAFIAGTHGKAGEPGALVYPEGTACAEVLISGEKGGAGGSAVFIGFGLAFAHKVLTEGMKLLALTVSKTLPGFSRVATIASDMASELLGVGYIIGVRTSSVMMAGAVMGYLVIVPMISLFGDQAPDLISPGAKPIGQMNLKEITDTYMHYVGAGCVTAAGIISMFRTLPMILRSFGASIGTLRKSRASGRPLDHDRRTEKDMPMSVVLLGSLGLIVVLALFLIQDVGFLSAVLGGLLVVLFGFLFVTVSSRLTGEIGSSSNPISGMTVATLALTSLIFLELGMTTPLERVLALSIGAVVCIAASNGGTTSQDLKTGFLVGATPRYQQWAIIIGALTSALVIGVTLVAFNRAGTVYTQKDLPEFNLKEHLGDLHETERYKDETYHLWWSARNPWANVKPGEYLVDDSGQIRFRVDPAITGDVSKRDDGSDVTKFEAPKTQVMALIINGVLSRSLNWGLVLIGGLIAVVLELCGVSSLAFAVGVYIPMQYSAPIFLGGLARWAVDSFSAWRRSGSANSRRSEAEAIAEEETSPGMLIASGYIAGGSLAGVMLSFLEFKPAWKEGLGYFSKYVSLDSGWAMSFALAVFGGLAGLLVFAGVRRRKPDEKNRHSNAEDT